MNLVANARDAMPNGGVIQVRLRTLDATDAKVFGDVLPPGTYTLLSVRDTGEGIPGELRDKIFEPFVTTKDTGHGLGLSTVYGAVMGAKGHIAITSERGEGTEMRVYLPIACAPPERTSSARVASVVPARRPSRRIAVCDDNAVFRAWVADVLTEAGHDVIVPADARAYLASPKEIPEIDLLVTDVRMPGVDGPTLRKRLRELLPGTPTVYMSGFSEGLLAQADKENQASGRAEAFLDKPFSREELLATVDGVLKARG
jgi:two-component system cell cycle sensor histidine kinase/response regulator CckA